MPKVLPCYHIYCIVCLEEYINSRSQLPRDGEGNGHETSLSIFMNLIKLVRILVLL